MGKKLIVAGTVVALLLVAPAGRVLAGTSLPAPPTFSFSVQQRGLDVTVTVNRPRPGSSPLYRMEVAWGDGTSSSRRMFVADGPHEELTFRHSYAMPRQPTSRWVMINLFDAAGQQAKKGTSIRIVPRYDVSLDQARFRALTHCDWIGKGDFDFDYRLRWGASTVNRDHSFDLGAFEAWSITRPILLRSVDLHNARPPLGLDWSWEERDFENPFEFPADFDSSAPGPSPEPIATRVGTVDKEYVEVDDDDCWVEIRFRITISLA